MAAAPERVGTCRRVVEVDGAECGGNVTIVTVPYGARRLEKTQCDRCGHESLPMRARHLRALIRDRGLNDDRA